MTVFFSATDKIQVKQQKQRIKKEPVRRGRTTRIPPTQVKMDTAIQYVCLS